MKTKTGLLALGLFTFAGAMMVSCGGSSDTGTDTGTAGKTSTAGNTGVAGTTNNTAGTTNNTAGTTNNTAGNTNNNGGNTNNNAGAPDQPAGGAGNNPQGCPATQPAADSMCMRPANQQGPFECAYGGDTLCACRRVNNTQMRTWQCDT